MSRNTSFPSFAGAALRLAACLLLAAGSLLAAAPAYAQGAAPAAPAPGPRPLGQIKIAVINTEQILLESQAGKKALADLKKVQEQKQGEIDKQQKEIHDLQVKIDDGRLSLAQDKLADLEKQMEDRVTGVRRMQEDASRELNKKKDDILGSVDQRVMPVINQIGKEMGYTLIFRKFESGLIYADEAVDITPAVIKRLDANQGK